MGELISKQSASNALEKCRKHCCREDEAGDKWIHYETALNEIGSIPSAQPKRGRWIERECGSEDKEEGWNTVIVCFKCDFPATTFYSEDCESRTQIRTPYCPNCGADMRKTI